MKKLATFLTSLFCMTVITYGQSDSTMVKVPVGVSSGMATTAGLATGGTTVGLNIYQLTNPSAITFLRVNADNSVTALSASAFRTAIGTAIGSNVQAYDPNLTTYAGITPSANVQTLLAAADYAAFKTSLSLGNVTNTSDASKPVSTAQQTALDLKADLASPTFTGTVVLPNSTVTNAMLAGSIAYSKLSLTGAVLNADLAGSIAYSKLNLTGAILNADLAGSIAYSKLSLTGAVLNADLAGSIDAAKINTGVVSNAEFNYLDGVSSAIQTQMDLKAPLSSPTFTGTAVIPAITSSGSTSIDFSGNSGTFKSTTGANTLGGAVAVDAATTPSVTLNSGKTNTGFFQVNGKTSGALKITAADAAAQTVTLNLAAQTTGAATVTIPDRGGASGTLAFTDAATLSSLTSIGTIGTGVWQGTVVGSTYGGTGVNNAGRTLTINTNSGTLAFSNASKTVTFGNSVTYNGTDATTMTFPSTSATIGRTDAAQTFTGVQTFSSAPVLSTGTITSVAALQTFPTNAATLVGRVATADIAATASATSATTIFTPTYSGWYRVTVYLHITTTGTSPVAGPVTITYTEPDGSVAQSHVLMMQNTSGAVVTTTVNNSTTTGTVTGSINIYAKTGVAIQYAIAVSGTFGSGRYQAHIICEAL
jgi:hypothetical protein